MGGCCSTRKSESEVTKPNPTSPTATTDVNVDLNSPTDGSSSSSLSSPTKPPRDDDTANLLKNAAAPPNSGKCDWTADEVFDIFDADNSNDLDIEELVPALTATLAKKISRAETEKIMKLYDTNDDFRLDRQEFVRCVCVCVCVHM